MDKYSSELQDYFIRLGKQPESVSERMEHYTKHLLHLLPVDTEKALISYYGLFGNDVTLLDDLAYKRRISATSMLTIIEKALRQLAISPEWQMMKQVV